MEKKRCIIPFYTGYHTMHTSPFTNIHERAILLGVKQT